MYQEQQEIQLPQQREQTSSYGNPLSNTLRHYSNHQLNQTQLARDLRVVSASGNDTYAHLEYADPYRDGGDLDACARDFNPVFGVGGNN